MKLYSRTDFTKHKAPPWLHPGPLQALMVTPPCPCPVYSEQTEGGLTQTAAICRKHCAGHTLAASGSLISCTQLFPFVMVDCGWALCWGVGLWAGVGTGAGGVNRLRVYVCVWVSVQSMLTHKHTAQMSDFWSPGALVLALITLLSRICTENLMCFIVNPLGSKM